MRPLIIAAAVSALVLLGSHGAIPVQADPHDAGATSLTRYAVDNPAQPGDAFPSSPWSGGTD
jgi:hypothetical protein